MTKDEFLKRIEEEELKLGEYLIVTDSITEAPYVLGCAYDEGIWKVYKTGERDGPHILEEYENENEAFDYFYKVVKIYYDLINKNY